MTLLLATEQIYETSRLLYHINKNTSGLFFNKKLIFEICGLTFAVELFLKIQLQTVHYTRINTWIVLNLKQIFSICGLAFAVELKLCFLKYITLELWNVMIVLKINKELQLEFIRLF
jgi:hypothetical protein